MTEITRVPLRPIAKGSLTKLWLGIVVLVLIAAGVAYAAMPKGLDIETITAGTGPTPEEGQVVFVDYVGTLPDGEEFDRSQQLPFPAGVLPEGTPMLLERGQVIDGFVEGLTQMQEGGTYRLFIPAEQAYGAEPPPGSPIAPNTDLTFEITLNAIMSREEAEQRFRALQQMMGSQMGPPPAEGAGQ
ncbi:peptidylprolyl isomerase [Erythrobacter litoralis]|uniref:FKBP-type peptidyl-prolyl cis-trans isomerase n=1 Tax=Erythrobacter litoralis TaxID=39960 RepID=UPI002434C143|nr:FKBP-type peptidyl-prolyl cis-trans isomerase [Erythrobacter litoralis]MDG6077991.1 peptidylprolyl isomerase [Erythrobacter litoralis]